MHISAKGGGGFSGQYELFDIDTAAHAAGRDLEDLLHSLDFGEAPPPAIGADIPRWEVTVCDGDARRTVVFTEDGSAAAAPWQSLIERLRNTA
ncbi:hypothetical protein [Massilia glaciei]|uniref:Uncharacterized protein n=1 Tax=Massilia glaciei TaxID=1524097 RepID=A0A2U2H907_9BURK|nr:hypothetical protein [Massilia glaciei]PWF39055.1 hypothetical protein C7C56_027740 [Massilia glaciei]